MFDQQTLPVTPKGRRRGFRIFCRGKRHIIGVPIFDKEVIQMAFFNKEKGKNSDKNKNVIQGALDDASAALKDDPLQEAVQKKKNNR